MPANARHKKARMLRDYMIETKTVNMFREEEKDDTIFFRSVYPIGDEKVQVVININDTVYLGVQSLLLRDVPVEKNEALLNCINKLNLELPTVKYVLTKDQCVIASMFFPVDENHFNAGLIMGVIVQVMKNVAEKHFAQLKTCVE